MCLRGRTGAHFWAQDIRRQVGAPSVQFSPMILCNFRPVLTLDGDPAIRWQTCEAAVRILRGLPRNWMPPGMARCPRARGARAGGVLTSTGDEKEMR